MRPQAPVVAMAFGSLGKKRRANLGLNRGQNLSIDVIEKIDPQQQGKRGPRAI